MVSGSETGINDQRADFQNNSACKTTYFQMILIAKLLFQSYIKLTQMTELCDIYKNCNVISEICVVV